MRLYAKSQRPGYGGGRDEVPRAQGRDWRLPAPPAINDSAQLGKAPL